MAIRRRRIAEAQEEESFFISMTDMMVGMLFLFIVMLMFFALKFNEAAVRTTETVQEILSADETRGMILDDVRRALQDQGISVAIDVENGILRLPESILFERNRADLTPAGTAAIGVLGRSLGSVLPCYATLPGSRRPPDCPATPHTVEAVFVEGHADSDGDDALNWALSVRRALSTYQALVEPSTDLMALRNGKGQALFSVSGYGEERPVQPNDSDDNKRQNRRIDLRFIMTAPTAVQIEAAGGRIRDADR